MLQQKNAVTVDLHRKGGLLTMDATPRRQWCAHGQTQRIEGVLGQHNGQSTSSVKQLPRIRCA